jgi:hypothetical protein
MPSTFSETAFEAFCAGHGIICDHVPEEQRRTPDYELSIDGVRVVVEVKEITRNKEGRESDRLRKERGYGEVTGGTPGDRVRKKIADCSAQIKARSAGRHPSMLVLFDSGRGHLDPYQIRVGMFGLEQIHIAVPPIGTGSPYATGMSYGPKRKMTPDQNTPISALAVFSVRRPNVTVLTVYHNPFATVPLTPTLLARFDIDQFELEESNSATTSRWRKIPSALKP